MSNTNQNVLASTFKGKVGKQFVMKTVNGKSVIAIPPKKTSKPKTVNQEAAGRNFKEAIQYAKDSKLIPERYAFYQSMTKPGQSAYTAAVKDFMKPAWITSIDTNKYAGKLGDKIRIFAGDSFKVASVTVTINDADGNLIETGQAVQADALWVYTVTAANTPPAGSSVFVLVYDLPGHPVTQSFTI